MNSPLNILHFIISLPPAKKIIVILVTVVVTITIITKVFKLSTLIFLMFYENFIQYIEFLRLLKEKKTLIFCLSEFCKINLNNALQCRKYLLPECNALPYHQLFFPRTYLKFICSEQGCQKNGLRTVCSPPPPPR